MTSGVSRELHVMHVAVFSDDAGIFALARDEGTKTVELFLIMGREEKIYRRNGWDNRWQLLEWNDLTLTLQAICHAINEGLAVSEINGKSDSIMNLNN